MYVGGSRELYAAASAGVNTGRRTNRCRDLWITAAVWY